MKHGTCIHFSGILSPKKEGRFCRAGVNYDNTFDAKKPGMFLRMPCIEFYCGPEHGQGTYVKPGEKCIHKPVDRHAETVIPCPHRQEPTEEQVQANREESEKHLKQMVAGLHVASEWRIKPKPPQDRREVVECPICKGKLHLFQSSYNGHVHGKCETKDCLSWME